MYNLRILVSLSFHYMTHRTWRWWPWWCHQLLHCKGQEKLVWKMKNRDRTVLQVRVNGRRGPPLEWEKKDCISMFLVTMGNMGGMPDACWIPDSSCPGVTRHRKIMPLSQLPSSRGATVGWKCYTQEVNIREFRRTDKKNNKSSFFIWKNNYNIYLIGLLWVLSWYIERA